MEFDQNLSQAIENNKLIIFIGAGLSKKCGLPLWNEVVHKILENDRIQNRETYKETLKNNILSPLEILDKLEKNYRSIVYETFEKETKDEIEDPIYGKITKLSKKIITTNFDRLIEFNTKIKTIEPNSNFNLSSLDNLQEYILKLHGTQTSIDNCLIFSSDYKKIYHDEKNLAKFQLKKIISQNTFLFIGFSFNDEYVTDLFNYLESIYQGYGNKHYIISKESTTFNFIKQIKISDYSEIELVIDELSKFNKSSSSTQDQIVLERKIQKNISYDTEIITTPIENRPSIEDWVGREEELKVLNNEFKAVFITGIGGQGKSSLASKFIEDANPNIYEYIDWRDFKEEDLNFQSKLYQLIQLVSNNKIQIESIIGLDTNDLINIFFNNLGNKKGLFIFDNIDKYIDLTKFTPSGEMESFFNKVMNISHRSKFIFTCRPFIQYASIGSFQIQLEGLKLNDTIKLLGKYYNNNNKIIECAERLHKATKGHPLWMALSIAQSRESIESLQSFIDSIEKRLTTESILNHSSLISRTVLNNLWTNLKLREKIILRALSVSAISESEEELAKILSTKINYNQFQKGIKSLKILNLVVTKSNSNHVELHPLVREFIVSNYGREEQEAYISLYVKYLDGFIYLIKEKFGKRMNSDDIEVILKKIEITNNSNDLQSSVNELRRSWESIIISGYAEEAIRLTDNLFMRLNWKISGISKLKGFNELLSEFLTKTSEFGRDDLFHCYIDKYNSLFTAEDRSKILSKSALCRHSWIHGDYDSAILEGRSACDLLDILGEQELWGARHYYNLSLRDSGSNENINEALIYFLEGSNLSEVLNENSDPQKLGNIGKCLSLLGKNEEAIKFLIKSYEILKNDSSSYINQHNLGYASKWISEYLEKAHRIKDSIYFLINTKNIWEHDMPVESNRIIQKLSKISLNEEIKSILNLERWQISKFCDDWINKIQKHKMIA